MCARPAPPAAQRQGARKRQAPQRPNRLAKKNLYPGRQPPHRTHVIVNAWPKRRLGWDKTHRVWIKLADNANGAGGSSLSLPTASSSDNTLPPIWCRPNLFQSFGGRPRHHDQKNDKRCLTSLLQEQRYKVSSCFARVVRLVSWTPPLPPAGRAASSPMLQSLLFLDRFPSDVPTATTPTQSMNA